MADFVVGRVLEVRNTCQPLHMTMEEGWYRVVVTRVFATFVSLRACNPPLTKFHASVEDGVLRYESGNTYIWRPAAS